MLNKQKIPPYSFADVFKFDPEYQKNEAEYAELSRKLLGSDCSDSDDDDDADGSGSGSSGDSDSGEEASAAAAAKQDMIIDQTETNMVALRRTIYLTIHSSLDYEECAHKLMKMQLKPGQEMELCHMFLDCCAEQRTYEKFYGLLAQRFCTINKIYVPPFEEIFKDTYATVHRLDTNRLRNVSKFFAHLLFTDAIGWDVLECIHLNEDDTTSSSRVFIKILCQELAEYMGLGKLNGRLKDATIQEAFAGLFPRDNPRNTRFAINFFTSIGLGGLTDELREHLKNAPKLMTPIVPVTATDAKAEDEKVKVISSSSSSSSSTSSSSSSSSDSSSSGSSSSSDSSDDSDSDSDSSSDSDAKKKRRSKDKRKRKAVVKKSKKSSKTSDKKSKKKSASKKDKKTRRPSVTKELKSRARDRDVPKPGRKDRKRSADGSEDERQARRSVSERNRRDSSAEMDRRPKHRREASAERRASNSHRRGVKENVEPVQSYWGREIKTEVEPEETGRKRRDEDRGRAMVDSDGEQRRSSKKRPRRSVSGERR